MSRPSSKITLPESEIRLFNSFENYLDSAAKSSFTTIEKVRSGLAPRQALKKPITIKMERGRELAEVEKEDKSSGSLKSHEIILRESYLECFETDSRPTIEGIIINTSKLMLEKCEHLDLFSNQDQSLIENLCLKVFSYNPKFLSNISSDRDMNLYDSLKENIFEPVFPARQITNVNLLGKFLKLNPQFADDCFKPTDKRYTQYVEVDGRRGKKIILPQNTTLFNHYLGKHKSEEIADLLTVLLSSLCNSELLDNEIQGQKIIDHISDLRLTNKPLHSRLLPILKEHGHELPAPEKPIITEAKDSLKIEPQKRPTPSLSTSFASAISLISSSRGQSSEDQLSDREI